MRVSISRKFTILLLLLLSLFAWQCAPKKKVDNLGFINRDAVYAQLMQISDKIMDWHLGNGRLENIHDNTATSIFINGNLARVLICTYELTGKQEYLQEGLRYCRFLAKSAKPVMTSKGHQAFWWYDMEDSKNLYLADTGTAMAALFKAMPYLNKSDKRLVRSRLDGFFRLITEGTDADPTNRNLGASPGWICKDSGALGVGYYRGRLEKRPYIVSTAQAGVLFGSLYYKLTKKSASKKMAVRATSWLLDDFGNDGALQYDIMGQVWPQNKFQANHYSIEALLCFFDTIKNKKLKNIYKERFPAFLNFILSSRNNNGLWGINRTYDAQRSIFMMTALIKAMRTGFANKEIQEAISKGLGWLQAPENAYSYGVNVLIRQTGFVGLMYADLLKEGITYSNPRKIEAPGNLAELTRKAHELSQKMDEFEEKEFLQTNETAGHAVK